MMMIRVLPKPWRDERKGPTYGQMWIDELAWPAGNAPVVDPPGDQHGDGPSEDAQQ